MTLKGHYALWSKSRASFGAHHENLNEDRPILSATKLEDCNIYDDEYKLLLEEIEKYHTMKEELRRIHAPAVSVIDEETKDEWIKRGRDQIRASFMKKLASSDSSSAWAVCVPTA